MACPADTNRIFKAKFTSDLRDANLSYFVLVDAVDLDESSLLCGDRNLTNEPSAPNRFVLVSKSIPLTWTTYFHREQGNICFGDGSVEGFANRSIRLTERLREGVTNRLAVP